MKVQIDKKELGQAVSRAAGAILDKTLGYIGLKTAEGKLHIYSASQSIVIYSEAECDILESGCIFVPAKFFMDIVKQLPDTAVILEKADSLLIISSEQENKQSFTMKIPVLDDKEWKERPESNSDNSAEIPCDKLLYAIEQVQFCVAFESPRNYGSVALFHKTEDKALRLVGSDGFRLSYSELICALPESFLEEKICLSKKALLELQKMCSEGFKSVNLSISEDKSALFASVEGYLVCIRLSFIKYPSYQGVLPKGELSPIEVPRSTLQNVAKRVMLASDKSNSLQLRFEAQKLTLQSKTVGSSEGKESVCLDGYNGKDLDLSVNGKYFSDVFSTISSDKIILNIKEDKDPFLLQPAKEPDDCRSVHVLVPIKQS